MPESPRSTLRPSYPYFCCFFFFNDTATTEIYTLSLHDALPICLRQIGGLVRRRMPLEPHVLEHRLPVRLDERVERRAADLRPLAADRRHDRMPRDRERRHGHADCSRLLESNGCRAVPLDCCSLRLSAVR